MAGHKEIAELLLSKGAKIQAVDKKGNTALLVAAEHGHSEVVQLLISQGALVSTQNMKGQTPLRLRSCQWIQESCGCIALAWGVH